MSKDKKAQLLSSEQAAEQNFTTDNVLKGSCVECGCSALIFYHYDDGSPVPEAPFVLTDSKNAQIEGKTDKKGLCLVEDMPCGPFEILLDEGSDEFKPAETKPNNPSLQVNPEHAALAGEYFTLFTLLRNKGFIEYDADDSSDSHIDIDDTSLFLNVPDEYEPAYDRFWELNEQINKGPASLRKAINKIHVSLPAEVVAKAGDNSAILLFCEIALGFIPVVGQAMDIYDLGEWGWTTYTDASARQSKLHWAMGALVVVGFVPGLGDALKKTGSAVIESLAKNSPEAIQAAIRVLRGLSNGNLVKFLKNFTNKIKSVAKDALALINKIIDGLTRAVKNGAHWIFRLMPESFQALITAMRDMAKKLEAQIDWVCKQVDEFLGKVVTRLTGTPRPKNTPKPQVGLNAGKDVKPARSEATAAKVDESNKARPGENGVCTNGCPIDMATGFVVDWRTDFVLPAAFGLSLKRFYYSSPDVEPGLLGRRWRAEWDMYLELDGDIAHFTDGEYNKAAFVIPAEGESFGAAHMPQWRFIRRQGQLLLKHLNGLEYQFNHSLGERLLLSSIADGKGRSHEFIYDRGHLKGVQLFDGRVIKVVGSRRRIDSLALYSASGELLKPLVSYQYDEHGFLQSCRGEPGRNFDYQYSKEGWLLRWQDLSHTWVEHDYDEKGRAIRSRGADKRFCDALHYDDDNRIVYYRSPLDGIKMYHRDERNNIIREVMPNGETLYREWQDNQLVRLSNALGETTQIERNPYGEPSRITAADGQVRQWLHNEQGKVLAYTNEAGECWQYQWDKQGNLVSVTDPLGKPSYFEYSGMGQLAWSIDADGEQTGFEYDNAFGLPSKVMPPGQPPLQLSYDELGRLAQVQSGEQRRRFSYQGVTALVSQLEDAQQGSSHFEYDLEGNLVQATDNTGASQRYRYGAFDLLLESIDALGHSLKLYYNGECQFAGITNSKGEAWRLEFNTSGQVVAETHLDGRQTCFEYDEAGRLKSRTATDGSSIHFYHDLCGRLLQKQTRGPSGVVMVNSHFDYDAAGRLIRGRNPVSEVEFEYDGAGRLIAETLNGASSRYHYSPAGRRVGSDGLLLPEQLNWQQGRLAQLSIGDFAPLCFDYNTQGHESRRGNGLGFLLQQSFTADGLLASQALMPQGDKGSSDGLRGRVSGIDRRYQYNHQRHLSAVEDSHWGRSEYAHNALGQIISEQRTAPWHEQKELRFFSYDSELQLTHIERQLSHNGDNKLVSLAEKRLEKSLQYGEAGRVVRQGPITLRYDANGRLLEKTVLKPGFRPQTRFFHWDEEDRLVQLSLENGDVWHYEYDVFGRRVRKYRSQQGRARGEVKYRWQGDQLCQQQQYFADGSIATTQWLYEPGSFRPLAQARQHSQLQLTQAVDSLTAGKSDNSAPMPSSEVELHLVVVDQAGTVRELCSEEGEVAWRGEAGLWREFEQWRLTGKPKHYLEQAANEPLHCDLRFQGQIYDRESGLYYNRHRYYDPDISQYLSPDPIGMAGGTRPQAYVHNPLEWVDPLGLAGFYTPYSFAAPSGSTHKVYQQNIDWDLPVNTRSGVKTNLDIAMEGGSPFVVKNGKYSQLNLHHSKQNGLGSMFELSADTHQRYHGSNALHPYLPDAHPFNPVDRTSFSDDRQAYWRERANIELEKRKAKVTKKC
ncbi:RHS repeat-associated core domain-containing protein [Shewanella khirikhana]|uniref:Deoxyribonuclease RhsC n=1 Tax=Shewanella khirikhana TaxID=1965282 RepID=A0ABN5TYQ5_9GAMM|nr:RHS repeat-associated core domain-containing protein [Shewanella khirikhana]AZQ11502.1 Putative deoxyribonuclease RhsC [Shewanella khirikhana]